MNTRKRWLIGGLALVVVAGVALGVSTLRSPNEDTRETSPVDEAVVDRTPVQPDPVPPLSDTPAPPKAAGQDSAADSQTVATASAAKPKPAAKPPAGIAPISPPPPVTPPTAPSDQITPPFDDPDPDPDPWDSYAEETTAIVEDNVEHLSKVASDILDALRGNDAPALSALLASDEGQQVPYLIGLANRYPTILEARPGANVNVFAHGEATVYVAYAVVDWRDAGLTSTHTIPLPMRFVDGQWRLTTLLDQPGELVFVTSVTL